MFVLALFVPPEPETPLPGALPGLDPAFPDLDAAAEPLGVDDGVVSRSEYLSGAYFCPVFFSPFALCVLLKLFVLLPLPPLVTSFLASTDL